MQKNQNNSVPVFILAGGLGTRLSEETALKPKPMVEVGDIPLLVHVMRSYYSFGFNDFVICAGYRSWEIKKYFLDYEFRNRHLIMDHREEGVPAKLKAVSPNEKSHTFTPGEENWRVRVIDTGLNTMTGGRVARAFDEISKTDDFEHFALTYGDGLSNVNLQEEFDFHKNHGKVGTVLGVHPVARFGELILDSENTVEAFKEKHQSERDIINGGFFFLKKEFRDYISHDENLILERAPLAKLASDKQLKAYNHTGFWHPVDTLRDKNHMQELWDSGEAPWVTY